jgi:hypothetical protein
MNPEIPFPGGVATKPFEFGIADLNHDSLASVNSTI